MDLNSPLSIAIITAILATIAVSLRLQVNAEVERNHVNTHGKPILVLSILLVPIGMILAFWASFYHQRFSNVLLISIGGGFGGLLVANGIPRLYRYNHSLRANMVTKKDRSAANVLDDPATPGK
jgi:hypothetical protein